MSIRYKFTKINKNINDNKSYMQSTIYPKVSASDSDIYIIVDETDRLDLLANKYYGDSSMWWIIANANNINDATFYIEPGTQLRIPTNVQPILSNLQSINK